MRARLDVVRDWMRGQRVFEWVEPRGGVVGLVRFAPGLAVDTAHFYDVLRAGLAALSAAADESITKAGRAR